MAKRIVVCSDGTGNTATKGRGTNVFKVFEAVDLDSHRYDPTVTPQIALYDDGVGTESFKPLKILAGATGWGLSRNVRQLYAELAGVYDPGDEIYMFGFSRGAFTVRTLGGLIATCGIVSRKKLGADQTSRTFHRAVRQAYRAYRNCYAPRWMQRVFAPSREAGRRFKKQWSHDFDVKIRFIGVWDTVDAVGLPLHLADILNATVYRFKFPDLKLSPIVERACQALAIDDERQSFLPLLWTEAPEDAERISQVWFAGAHSNVGGGYPKQGMSLVALDWMLHQAEAAGQRFNQDGLRLNRSDRESFREHASVDDKLYDPRAGLGVFYRWKVRDIRAICDANNVKPKVHVSVLERIAHGADDYAPGNLPSNAEVVFTPPPRAVQTDLARGRAAGVKKVLATVPHGNLLHDMTWYLRAGQLSYVIYIVSCVTTLTVASQIDPQLVPLDPLKATEATLGVVGGLLTDPFATAMHMVTGLIRHPALLSGIAGGFLVAYLLTAFVDRAMQARFSRFWYSKQSDLRDELKKARVDANARR